MDKSRKAAAKPAAARKVAPADKPAARKQATAKPAKKTARDATGKPPATGKAPASEPKPPPDGFPYDPYDLSLYFKTRTDLLAVLPDPAEALRYRLDSARAKAGELQRVLDRFVQHIEAREDNIRRASAAVYLLGRAQRAPSHMAPGMTSVHLLVMRSTLKAEAAALPDRRAAGAAVAEELDQTVELARQIEATSASGSVKLPPPAGDTPPAGITEPLVQRADRETRALVDERAFGTPALLAVLAMEQMAREESGRQPLQAFAPPPPMDGAAFADPDAPLPREATRRKPRKNDDSPPAPPPAHGTTIGVPQGTAVLAANDGKVGYAGPFRGYGNLVVLEHSANLFSVYGYLEQVKVEPGQRLSRGERIGTAGVREGAAAPGFYFEVRKGDKAVPASDLVGSADLKKLLTD